MEAFSIRLFADLGYGQPFNTADAAFILGKLISTILVFDLIP